MPLFQTYLGRQRNVGLRIEEVVLLSSPKFFGYFCHGASFVTTTFAIHSLNQAWVSRGPDSIIGNEASQTWLSPMLSQSRVKLN